MNLLARLPASARAWRMLLGLAVFQAAWFACVALAARDQAGAGVGVIAVAVLLHLAVSDKPAIEMALLAAAMGLGLAWETLALGANWTAYAAPGPWKGLVPAWILALWALFATTLREPLRWMHGRPWLAALFGAVGGPLSYAAAARMGACRFGDPVVSLAALAAGWALMTPLLVELARRLDAAGKEPAR